LVEFRNSLLCNLLLHYPFGIKKDCKSAGFAAILAKAGLLGLMR
jgi:hypothetical protein